MGWFLLPYFMLLLHFPFSTCSLCNHHDSSALLQFKNSLALDTSLYYYWGLPSSSFSSKTESWKNGTDCCEWNGVTCDTKSGHVIGLDLSNSNLQGILHPNTTLFHLTHLQKLNLAFNDFYGSLIYSGFGDLLNLMHLNLSHSLIGGDISTTISHLSKLVSLDLNEDVTLVENPNYLRMRLDPFTWNKLILNATSLRDLRLNGVDMSSIKLSSLSLLMNFSSSLVTLSLGFAGLQGNLPSDIFFLPNLKELILAYNMNLMVELPKSNWTSPLGYLELSATTFSREIPNSIGHLKSLNYLRLQNCNINGLIPLSLGNLTQLTFLDLSFNYLNGEIPSLLSNLNQLNFIDLASNNFSGHIPDVFDKLMKLETLVLSVNNLEGLIPSSLFHLPQLSDLQLSSNKLVGPIPSTISEVSKLNVLDLSYNMLNGTIPNWCYSLPSLSTLFLPGNQLIGSISEFSTYSLQVLCLNDNKLQGNFPNSVFELKNLTGLILSSNDMEGLVDFHQFSKLKNLIYLGLSKNGFVFINIDSSVNQISPNLEYLDLSYCNISSFPQFLAQLPNLQRLDLSNNKIQGKIPKWFLKKFILSWKVMDYINLNFNKLQGDLPILPNGIRYFLISNNNFSGDISSTICNASFLVTLNLAHNNLTGMIPQCVGALPFLKVLDLQMNKLHGSIPGNFSEGNALETIKLNGNRLEGPLPKSLAHYTKLEVLDLADNNIEDTFPSWLETLQELKVLILRSNKLHGVITCLSTKNPFPKLKIFDVSNNKFSGPLPTSYIKNFGGMMTVNDTQTGLKYIGNSRTYHESVVVIMKGFSVELVRILTTFTTIDLSNNKFEGEIPQVIGELISLKGLNLSHNRIIGAIPESLSNLRNLEWLDLSWNRLKGEIPMALTNLNFLAHLNLSQNQLKGIIPTGRQFNTFGNDSYVGNPMLCGFPLSKSCNKDEKLPPPSSFHHEESLFGWKVVAVGYASGMVFGMVLGYNVFSNGKPIWLARLVEGVFNVRLKRTNK